MVPRDDMVEHVSAVASEKRKNAAGNMSEENIMMCKIIARR